MTHTIRMLAATLCGLVFAPVAWSQYPYNPYYPRSSPGYNYLNGKADVNRAQGDYLKSQEDARITQNKYNQMKIDTKKKAFDEMLYEQAHTPSYTDQAMKDQAAILTRLMNAPIKSEIVEGKTLNTMLPYLQHLTTSGTSGPPVPVSQAALREVNVSSSGGTSIGVLRDGGRVEWPLGLQGSHSKKLDKLLPAAFDATAEGKLTPKLMKDVRTEMTAMRADLAYACQKDLIETSSYMRALEFYNSLVKSVNALEAPDAKKQLTGVSAPRGRNVQELVNYMSDNGLKFARANPDGESAYRVMHESFVRYARTAESSMNVQSLGSPVALPQKKK